MLKSAHLLSIKNKNLLNTQYLFSTISMAASKSFNPKFYCLLHGGLYYIFIITGLFLLECPHICFLNPVLLLNILGQN